MILTKEVHILDKSVFKVGRFVTYCPMQLIDWGQTVRDGKPINGMIHYVDDKYFTVIDHHGDKKRIDVESLIDIESVTSKMPKYKILGLMDNAITK